MAINFGKDEAPTVTPDATSDATFNIRGWAGMMCVGGLAALAVPPVAALGAVFAVLGGVVWALAPATEPAAQQMAAESAQGGGCGAALGAVALVVVIVAVAIVLAIGAGLAVTGGGL